MSMSMSPSAWTAGKEGEVGEVSEGEETLLSYEDREEGIRGKMAKTMANGGWRMADGGWRLVKLEVEDGLRITNE